MWWGSWQAHNDGLAAAREELQKLKTQSRPFQFGSRSEVFVIQLFLKLLALFIMLGNLLLILQLSPLLLDNADSEDAEEGQDRERDDEDGQEGQHVPGQVEQGGVDLPLGGDPPRPVVIS